MSTVMLDGPTRVRPIEEPIREQLSQKQIQSFTGPYYGWSPYDDIELMGPNGLERRVAYNRNGDFETKLTRGELLYFQNVEIRELNEKDNNIPNGPKPVMENVVKYAIACISEIYDAYAEWGFTVLPLTMMAPKEAFRVFEVIQPMRYDLSTIEDELIQEAPKRIARAAAADKTFPAAVAEETRRIMVIGARRAVNYAQNVVDSLRSDMATFIGTKVGKSHPSPGDEHAFLQLHEPIPSPIAAKAQSSDAIEQLLIRLAEKELKGDAPTAQELQLKAAAEAMEQLLTRQKDMEKELKALKEAAKRKAPAGAQG